MKQPQNCAVIATAPLDEAPWAAAVAGCPKRMQHGPCAGVGRDDGSCEVPGVGTCSFIQLTADAWCYPSRTSASAQPPETTPAVATFLQTAARRQVVVLDLPAAPLSSAALLASAAELGAADALLTGDHGAARVQFPPSYRAKLLADRGYPVWVGINCRDRNRIAVEAEIAASADSGAVGVHCVTGDHTALGDRPDAQPVFDLDSVDVVRLVTGRGVLASVAHAPAAPPLAQRVPRLLAKADAGAHAVFVDHCGGPAAVAAAVAEMRSGGFAGLVVVCVPVVIDAASADVVESFALGRLPDGYVRGILAAPDTVAAGISAAAELCAQVLAIPGVDGVDLSCGGGPGSEFTLARHLGEIGRRVHAVVESAAHPRPLPEVPR